MTPYGIQYFLPAEGLSGIFHKQLHQAVFHLRQLHPLPVLFQSAVAQIQRKGRTDQLAGLFLRLSAAAAAHQRVHPGRQFGGGKGLGHIVVRAGHQSRYLVHLLRTGCQHNDADIGVICPQAAAYLKSVDTRQHHVQQRHTDIPLGLQLFQCFLAAFRLDHLVAGAAQIDNDKAPDIGLILQYQYLFHAFSFPVPSPQLLEGCHTVAAMWKLSFSLCASIPYHAAPSYSSAA